MALGKGETWREIMVVGKRVFCGLEISRGLVEGNFAFFFFLLAKQGKCGKWAMGASILYLTREIID